MANADPTPRTDAQQAARDRLASLVLSPELGESQCAELAAAADLLMSEGSVNYLAALARIEGIVGATRQGVAPVFDPGKHSIAGPVFDSLPISGHLDVTLELSDHVREPYHRITHIRFDQVTPGVRALLRIDGMSVFTMAWPVDELGPGWIPYTQMGRGSNPVVLDTYRSTDITFEFTGPPNALIGVSLALETVTEEPGTVGFYGTAPRR